MRERERERERQMDRDIERLSLYLRQKILFTYLREKERDCHFIYNKNHKRLRERERNCHYIYDKNITYV